MSSRGRLAERMPLDVELSGDELWATRYSENGSVLAVFVFLGEIKRRRGQARTA